MCEDREFRKGQDYREIFQYLISKQNSEGGEIRQRILIKVQQQAMLGIQGAYRFRQTNGYRENWNNQAHIENCRYKETQGKYKWYIVCRENLEMEIGTLEMLGKY